MTLTNGLGTREVLDLATGICRAPADQAAIHSHNHFAIGNGLRGLDHQLRRNSLRRRRSL